MLFAMIQAEPRMQTKPIVFYLFVVWSSIEVARFEYYVQFNIYSIYYWTWFEIRFFGCFRYPYYMLRTYNCDIGLITWLRYTLWIPLYPLGFLCEGKFDNQLLLDTSFHFCFIYFFIRRYYIEEHSVLRRNEKIFARSSKCLEYIIGFSTTVTVVSSTSLLSR